MSGLALGRVDWNGTRDADGHRKYWIKWLVKTTSVLDGPANVFNAAGLAAPGSTWGYGGDIDLWAFCSPELKVEPTVKNEKSDLWYVEQTFTTQPFKRCMDTTIEDPLDEPPKISGGFVKYTEEATQDRNGQALKYSNHERIRGPLVEFDKNRPSVHIEMNVLSLPLILFSEYYDAVNDSTLWGLGPRKIKLSNAQWERKLYGTCSYYYTVKYDFDISFKTFDRKIIDEGYKILRPGGDPDDPADFIVAKDKRGNNIKVPLNGAGEMLGLGEDPFEIDVERYDEVNLLLLDIPPSL